MSIDMLRLLGLDCSCSFAALWDRARRLGHDVKNELPHLLPTLVPDQAVLPIYGSGRALLGYVSLDSAQRMLSNGQAVPLGTKRRVRALAATRDNYELLAGDRLPTNCKYSHKRETPLNPKGVWTFRRPQALT